MTNQYKSDKTEELLGFLKTNFKDLSWRVHGMGLAQAYHGDYRYHVWHPDFVCKERSDQFIHNHRWFMTSHVLLGEMIHIEYRWEPHEDGNYVRWIHANSSDTSVQKMENGFVFPEERMKISEGNCYDFNKLIYHEASPFIDSFDVPNCITVIRRHMISGSSSAIIPVGVLPVNGLTMIKMEHDDIIEKINSIINGV